MNKTGQILTVPFKVEFFSKLSQLWFSGSSSELWTGCPAVGAGPAADEAGCHAAGCPGPDLAPRSSSQQCFFDSTGGGPGQGLTVGPARETFPPKSKLPASFRYLNNLSDGPYGPLVWTKQESSGPLENDGLWRGSLRCKHRQNPAVAFMWGTGIMKTYENVCRVNVVWWRAADTYSLMWVRGVVGLDAPPPFAFSLLLEAHFG